MKKKILLLLWLTAITMSLSTNAQTLTSQVTGRYPASVISKVYEVVSNVNLTTAKQIQLAAHFQKEDSLIALAVVNNASSNTIANIHARMKNEFQSILATQELNEYYTTLVKENARKETKIIASLTGQKYGCDSTMENKLYGVLYTRKILVDVAFLQYSGSPELDSKVSSIIVQYDTVTDKYLTTISSVSFFNKKTTALDSIKPMTQNKKQQLENSYLALCKKYKDKSFADNYNEAMYKVITDTAYYASLYHSEIKKRATSNSLKTFCDLTQHNQVTKDGIKSLNPLIYEKEKKLATINLAFPIYTRQKDSLIRNTVATYDSLISVTLMKDGSLLDKSQFTLAVKHRKSLALSQTQVDSLLGKAIALKKIKDNYLIKNPDCEYDSKAYESENMSKILTEDQYTNTLKFKTQSQAKNDALNSWDELKQRNLTAGSDSSTVIKQLTNYYMARSVAYYRYGNDKNKQSANLKAIDKTMPEPVKKLNAARNKPVSNQVSQGTFQW